MVDAAVLQTGREVLSQPDHGHVTLCRPLCPLSSREVSPRFLLLHAPQPLSVYVLVVVASFLQRGEEVCQALFVPHA